MPTEMGTVPKHLPYCLLLLMVWVGPNGICLGSCLIPYWLRPTNIHAQWGFICSQQCIHMFHTERWPLACHLLLHTICVHWWLEYQMAQLQMSLQRKSFILIHWINSLQFKIFVALPAIALNFCIFAALTTILGVLAFINQVRTFSFWRCLKLAMTWE